MRGFYAAGLALVSLMPAAPLAAADYGRFPTYEADGWTVTDEGDERCDADFRVDGAKVLSFMGPYYFRPDEPASGSILHLGDASQYMLPKGDKHGEFPAELSADGARFEVTGFATDLGRALVVDSGKMPTVIDLLAALPDTVTLRAAVGGKPAYAIALTGNHGATKAMRDCTAFISAQKRPGTKDGAKLGPPKPPQREVLTPLTLKPSLDQMDGAPPTALPEAPPPNGLPPPK